jgi:O-acetyl-ADP-ribose deacetylase (regulator of RNase III)
MGNHRGDHPNVVVHRGSILDVHCDAVVSPANSFGFMDGGIDALYTHHFGIEVQIRVGRAIYERHHGELIVGNATIVETGNPHIPYLIDAPTIRVPMILRDTASLYLATPSWAEASEHRQFLYTHRPKGLQRE